MAVSKLNPVSGGKTRFLTTLTSGTSYTVPAGVTYLNVTLRGGGGGAGSGHSSVQGTWGNFGAGGQIVSSTLSTTPGASISYAIGAGGSGGVAPSTAATAGGTTTFTGATSATGGAFGLRPLLTGTAGTNFQSANNGGLPGIGGSNEVAGAGGSGSIDVEYWV
jgi:hypothetical protein